MKVERKKRAEINFKRDYVNQCKPVVITDLYSNDPISKINTPAKASKAFGEIPIGVRGSYEGLFASKTMESEISDIKTYLDHISKNPNTQLYCSELRTPEEISSTFTIPRESMNGSDSPLSFIFLGSKNTRTIFHWDGDYRHVLLTQVFGRKRIYLVSPEFSESMVPIFNLSGIQFNDLTKKEKEIFIKQRKGYVVDIGPGETLYFPKTYWHYVEYLTDNMSVNVRFSEDKLLDFLFSIPSHLYQTQMLSMFVKNNHTAMKIAVNLLKLYYSPFPTGIDRHQALTIFLNEQCKKYCSKKMKKFSTYPELNIEQLLISQKTSYLSNLPSYNFTLEVDRDEIEPSSKLIANLNKIEELIKDLMIPKKSLKKLFKLFELPNELSKFEVKDAYLLRCLLSFGISHYLDQI